MNSLRNKWLLALLCIFTSLPVWAQVVAHNDDVTIGTLDNGLKYYIHPNGKPSKKLELRLVISAGSMQETESQRGLAHFTEHMMFNGTKSYPKNTLIDKLETMGIAFGADLNAYTSFDETVYILPIPTEEKNNVEEGFKILKEWAGDALMLEQDIDAERAVIIEESRLHKSADRRMYEKFFPKLFNQSLYAYRLPIGKDSVILHAPYHEFSNFYQDWYRPNLMAVVAVGDITVEEAERLIKQYFGALKNPSVIKEKVPTVVAPYAKNEAMVLTDKEATSYAASFYYSPRVKENPSTIQAYRNSLVNYIWVNALNKRLRNMKEQAQPPFTSAYVGVDGFMKGYEGLMVTVVPNAQFESSVKTTFDVVNSMRVYGITEEELALATKSMMATAENQLKEKNTTSSSALVNQYVAHFLNQLPIEGPELQLHYLKEMLPSITVAEVNKDIQKWIMKEQTMFATVTGPESGKLTMPTEKAVVKWMDNALTDDAVAYEAKAIKNSLVDVDVLKTKQGSIVKEYEDKELGVTYFELNNGVKVALKNTNFKSDEIIMGATNYGGSGQYNTTSNQNKENVFFANSFLDMLGYGDFAPSDLANYMVGKKANISFGMSEVENKISGSSTVQDFETMMQLLHLKLTSLRKDEVMFQSVMNTYKTQFAALGKNPQYEFIDTMTKIMYNNSKLAPIAIPTEQVFDHMQLDSIYTIYKEQFKDPAANYFYAFSGNIDINKFKEYITLYLGSLPEAMSPVKWVDNGLRPVQGFNEFEYAAGIDDKALIVQMVHGKLEYSQSLDLKANMLMEVLNFKVIEEVREKLGAIYGGGYAIDVQRDPFPYYTVVLQLPCGPDNVDLILRTIATEIDNVKKNGVTQKDLEKVLANYQESHRTAMESNSVWVSKIMNIERWEHDKYRFLNYKDTFSQISTNDLKATANLLFGGVNSNIFQAILYPKDYKNKK